MEFNSNYLISIYCVICKNVIESKKWFIINIYIKKIVKIEFYLGY